MNIIEIKGLYPGAGKSTALIKLAKQSAKCKKVETVILAPTNKAVQELKNKAKGTKLKIQTIMSFKGNYKCLTHGPHNDFLEFNTKIKKCKKAYNFFIDEASLCSKEEIEDLLQAFYCENLVLDGDILQFKPISQSNILLNANKKVTITKEEEALQYFASTETFKPENSSLIVLNQAMRASDPKLKEFLEDLKKGYFGNIDALYEEEITPEMIKASYSVAYTKEKCREINAKVDKVERWIISNNDYVHSFWKGEIYEGEEAFEELKTKLTLESLMNSNVPDFKDWLKRFTKPAYAINAHKLQGTTIETADLYIYMDDLLGKCSFLSAEETQRFLYVACSRVRKLSQLHLVFKKGKGYDIEGRMKAFKELKDDFESEKAYFCGPAYAMLDEVAVWDLVDEEALAKHNDMWKNKSYSGRIARDIANHTHAVKHKQHKQNWTQEMLEDSKILSWKEWFEKHGKSNTLYYKLKKM